MSFKRDSIFVVRPTFVSMKNKTFFRTPSTLSALFVLSTTAAIAQPPMETATVTDVLRVPSLATRNSNDWNTPLATYNGVVYLAHVNNNHYLQVRRKASGSNQTWFTFADAGFVPDDLHLGPSIGIDSEGYIHVVALMHNSPIDDTLNGLKTAPALQSAVWKYWVSDKPNDVSAFTFIGSNSSRTIPGYSVSYPWFTQGKSGSLFICWRGFSGATKVNAAGRFNLSLGTYSQHVARYDAATKTWTELGGLATQFAGNPSAYKSLIWEPNGGAPSVANGVGWYQPSKPRIYPDRNGRLHLVTVVNANGNALGGPSAVWYAGTNVIYAYSDDDGTTWKNANGVALPLPFNSGSGANVVARTTGDIYNTASLAFVGEAFPRVLWAHWDTDSNKMIQEWSRYDSATKQWIESPNPPVLYSTPVTDAGGRSTAVRANQYLRSDDGFATFRTYDWPSTLPLLSAGGGGVRVDDSYFRGASSTLFVTSASKTSAPGVTPETWDELVRSFTFPTAPVPETK